jgi:hypothetical protein
MCPLFSISRHFINLIKICEKFWLYLLTYKNHHCALGYVHICLLLCGSYMFRHLRAMLIERLCPCELLENWNSCVGLLVTWICVICVPVCGAVLCCASQAYMDVTQCTVLVFISNTAMHGTHIKIYSLSLLSPSKTYPQIHFSCDLPRVI